MFGDIGKIMKIAGQMKKKMPELKERLAASQYTATTGGDKVTVTVNGKMQLTDLKFAPGLLADGSMEAEMLEDLIKAAISSAQAQAAQEAAEAMKELTGGMDIPGLDAMM
jgi:DNA-binding YbaB/EbfC family protein